MSKPDCGTIKVILTKVALKSKRATENYNVLKMIFAACCTSSGCNKMPYLLNGKTLRIGQLCVNPPANRAPAFVYALKMTLI